MFIFINFKNLYIYNIILEKYKYLYYKNINILYYLKKISILII